MGRARGVRGGGDSPSEVGFLTGGCMLYEPSRALLQRWFPAEEIGAVDPLRGGTVNDVYRIETPNGVFVLRIAGPASSLDAELCEHAWVTHIAARMPEVIAPLAAPG